MQKSSGLADPWRRQGEVRRLFNRYGEHMSEKNEIARSEADRMGVVIENDRDIAVFEWLLHQVGAAVIENAVFNIKSQSLRRVYAGNIARALGLRPPAYEIAPIVSKTTRADVATAVELVKRHAEEHRSRNAERAIRENDARRLEDELARAASKKIREELFERIARRRGLG